ncbi:MAG: hypothetical protein Ct9H90mP27_0280 [Gammaproteobacteria bacterium]|nr:MAG: hypothetical protein Ct9H90mP27_0280 [Gammaproteobacteria bacterium]
MRACTNVMRKYGLSEPYERLKKATRGEQLDEELFQKVLGSFNSKKGPGRVTDFDLNPTLALPSNLPKK